MICVWMCVRAKRRVRWVAPLAHWWGFNLHTPRHFPPRNSHRSHWMENSHLKFGKASAAPRSGPQLFTAAIALTPESPVSLIFRCGDTLSHYNVKSAHDYAHSKSWQGKRFTGVSDRHSLMLGGWRVTRFIVGWKGYRLCSAPRSADSHGH